MIRSLLAALAPFAVAVIGATSATAQDALDVLSADDRFDTFAELIRETGLDDALGGSLTVFAPTDEAFRRMPDALRDRLEDPAARDILRRVAALHLVTSGPHESDDLPVEMQALAEDARIVVTYTRGALTLRPAQPDDISAAEAAMRARAVTEARVRVGDIRADDAIVHGIDMVMLPPDLDDRLAALDGAAQDDDGVGIAGTGTVRVDVDQPDFAARIAETDDGDTVDVTSGGVRTELVPMPSDDDPVIPDVTFEDEPDAPERQVFVYDPDSPPPAVDAPAPTREVAEVDELPGRIVTLPASDAPARLPAREAPEADRRVAATDDPQAIDLAAQVISVATLIGQDVRDGTGGELGEVVDVLISMDTADARTLVYAEESGPLNLEAVGIGEPETVRVDMRRIAIDPVDGTVIVQGDAD